MCRILGCVSQKPTSIRRELVDAPNPMIRQSEEHDSGWGIACYRDLETEPRWLRFPQAAHADRGFVSQATEMSGRIFNVHVRRATMGGLTLENTHPFCSGALSFGHNGTILNFARLATTDIEAPRGETDSEYFFNFLRSRLDRSDIVGSLREAVAAAIERSTLSGVNFLFSEGRRLYAYRFGIFELHWLARPGKLFVSSERLTSEQWEPVGQDVLLTCDPDKPAAPSFQRLVGDEIARRANVVKFEEGSDLRGTERGEFAARRAERLASGAEK